MWPLQASEIPLDVTGEFLQELQEFRSDPLLRVQNPWRAKSTGTESMGMGDRPVECMCKQLCF